MGDDVPLKGHYRLEGCKPIQVHTLDEYIKCFPKCRGEEGDPWRVALTSVGIYRVSTVFLGISHQYDPDLPPILFETMVFRDATDGRGMREWERLQVRYMTWGEAEQGHQEMVDQMKTRVADERIKEMLDDE